MDKPLFNNISPKRLKQPPSLMKDLTLRELPIFTQFKTVREPPNDESTNTEAD
jgi:hypothetical protein